MGTHYWLYRVHAGIHANPFQLVCSGYQLASVSHYASKQHNCSFPKIASEPPASSGHFNNTLVWTQFHSAVFPRMSHPSANVYQLREHERTHKYTHTRRHSNQQAHTHTHTHTHKRIDSQKQTYTHRHTQGDTQTYTHNYKYTYTHTHTHKHTYRNTDSHTTTSTYIDTHTHTNTGRHSNLQAHTYIETHTQSHRQNYIVNKNKYAHSNLASRQTHVHTYTQMDPACMPRRHRENRKYVSMQLLLNFCSIQAELDVF